MSKPPEPPSNNIYSLPPKTPRYTTQDHEELNDARRLVTLRGSVKQLATVHSDLHRIFGDVVKADAEWPFFSVRQLQTHVADFDFLTKNPDILSAARTMARVEVAAKISDLGKALLIDTGLSLKRVSGSDLRENFRLLHLKEDELALAKDVLSGATPSEQETLIRVTDLTHRTVQFMYDTSMPLPETGQKILSKLDTNAPHQDSMTPRQRHLRMAEHWVHAANGELKLMKLDLLADYADQNRHERADRIAYEGFLMSVTEPRRSFIDSDANSHRDLAQADKTLHLALTH